MDLLFLLGRILFGGYFIMSAFSHFTKANALAGYAQSKNVPMAKTMVIASGLLLLIGGLGIVFGVNIELAVAALALFLVPVTFAMHNFWAVKDPMQKMSERLNFTKNLALLGADLMILAIPAPWSYSLMM